MREDNKWQSPLRIPNESEALDLVRRICAIRGDSPFLGIRSAFVIAHPDDEVIGAGSLLQALGRDASFMLITDGSPRDLHDARAAGFSSREEYAAARRKEFEAVLENIDAEASHCRWLEIADQEASFHLSDIARAVAALLAEIKPDVILTHPYEGGHPDHDAAAFAVAAAQELLLRSGLQIPAVEFASYNGGLDGDGWMTCFLPNPGYPEIEVHLSIEEQARKRRLLECYRSQSWIMDVFDCVLEHFRPAPLYDFGKPPHLGRLHYERYSWGVTGIQWRAFAREAGMELGIRGFLENS